MDFAPLELLHDEVGMKGNRWEQVAQLSVLGQGRKLLPVELLHLFESESCLGSSYYRHQPVKEDVLIYSFGGGN